MPILPPGQEDGPFEGTSQHNAFQENWYGVDQNGDARFFTPVIDSRGPGTHTLTRNPGNSGHRGRRRPRLSAAELTGAGTDQVFVPPWDMCDVSDDQYQEYYASVWDRITLGPFTFSGTCKIGGDGPKLSVDKRRKKGALVQKLVTNGYDTTELKITLRLWTAEQLEDYSALVSEVNPKRTGKPYAIEVYHPALALAKIQYILVYGVSFLLPSGQPGIYESTLSALEFLPQSESQRNATRSATQTPRLQQPPALDPVFHTQNDNPLLPATPSQTAANP